MHPQPPNEVVVPVALHQAEPVSRQLPFTGLPLLLLLAISAAMLAAGLALRHATRTVAAAAYSGSELTAPRRSAQIRPGGAQRTLRLPHALVWMLLLLACLRVLVPRSRRR